MNITDDDRRRLKNAIISYGALTGRGVGKNPDAPDIDEIGTDPELVASLTSLMADIYRREMREKIFGWKFDRN
jgi:hypothetical protein